ncbi:hypothetical protein BGZ83_006860 [Gryganskiella cystojenkinii]|nr:hypothetical protein BGZ83_006860 [Gryganskiella cystojenkinii]
MALVAVMLAMTLGVTARPLPISSHSIHLFPTSSAVDKRDFPSSPAPATAGKPPLSAPVASDTATGTDTTGDSTTVITPEQIAAAMRPLDKNTSPPLLSSSSPPPSPETKQSVTIQSSGSSGSSVSGSDKQSGQDATSEQSEAIATATGLKGSTSDQTATSAASSVTQGSPPNQAAAAPETGNPSDKAVAAVAAAAPVVKTIEPVPVTAPVAAGESPKTENAEGVAVPASIKSGLVPESSKDAPRVEEKATPTAGQEFTQNSAPKAESLSSTPVAEEAPSSAPAVTDAEPSPTMTEQTSATVPETNTEETSSQAPKVEETSVSAPNIMDMNPSAAAIEQVPAAVTEAKTKEMSSQVSKVQEAAVTTTEAKKAGETVEKPKAENEQAHEVQQQTQAAEDGTSTESSEVFSPSSPTTDAPATETVADAAPEVEGMKQEPVIESKTAPTPASEKAKENTAKVEEQSELTPAATEVAPSTEDASNPPPAVTENDEKTVDVPEIEKVPSLKHHLTESTKPIAEDVTTDTDGAKPPDTDADEAAAKAALKAKPPAVAKDIHEVTDSGSTEGVDNAGIPLETQILPMINEKRARNQADPLVWNTTLAHFATLRQEDNCTMVDSDERERRGVTYKMITGVDPSRGPDIGSAVSDWYEEFSFYNFMNPTQSSVHQYFVQLVWRATTQVGCAIKDCGVGKAALYCEYDSAGNSVIKDPPNYPDKFKNFRKNVFPALPTPPSDT